jgi:cyanophycin synthetase
VPTPGSGDPAGAPLPPLLPPPLFQDSRRLFGPSPWLEGPGSVLDVPLPHGHDAGLLRAWRDRVAAMQEALGWAEGAGGVPQGGQRHASGTILALAAPPQVLLSATALNEWALQAAAEELLIPYDPGSIDDDALPPDPGAALEALRARVDAEGAGPPDALLFETPPHVRIALVTGSNGKTTTTRLLAAILREHGHTVGFTSTDGVHVGGQQVERGDWSGPLGAVRVLQDPSVTVAVLETARGGLLRRGLVVRRADVAVITNVAEDHFGEYGIDTIEDLARVKGLVARALGPGGMLVLNGDDPILSPGGPADPGMPPCVRPLGTGEGRGFGAATEVRRFSLSVPWPAALPPVEEIPITAGGRARYNAENVLAATMAARALGVPDEVTARTLLRFGTDPADNPGRLVRASVGGVHLLLDYAHNPAGLSQLLELARSELPSGGRLLVLLGQAGDREDEAIRALARAAWSARPDRVILREMTGYARGRAPGEVPSILADELGRQGADAGQVQTEADELEAVREALRWSRPGDLLVLPIHGLASREAVLFFIDALGQADWKPGAALPGD